MSFVRRSAAGRSVTGPGPRCLATVSLLVAGALPLHGGSLFSSVVDEFAVLFPAPPHVERSEVEVAGVGTAKMRLYRVDEPKTEWLVSATDVERLALDPSRTLASARTWVVEKSGGKLVSERPLRVGGYESVDLRLERPDGSVIRTRICVTRRRIYQATVLTTEEWRRRPQVERFLDSFAPD